MNVNHIVRHGETLSSIARRYGASINDLKVLNRVTDPNKLRQGAVLQIPAFRPFDAPALKKTPLSNKPAADAPPSKQWSESVWDAAEQVFKCTEKLWHDVTEAVIHPIREQESAEAIHEKGKVPLEKRPLGKAPIQQNKAHPSKSSQSKLHRNEVLQQLKDRLDGIKPVLVTTKGVQLTANERKKIVAGIGLCEVSSQVFSSENSDQEFVGRKFGNRGIETGYSRIVHIGLSYGYIQFTQDSGSLGKLLKRMRDADKEAFDSVFRKIGASENSKHLPAPNIDLLIHMTTEGLKPDEISPPYHDKNDANKSGQGYWASIRKTAEGGAISRLANQDENKDGKSDLPETREIRGARVHKIPYRPGERPEDIWCGNWAIALTEIGRIPKFQDIQLEQAVDSYFNKALPHCKENNIRTAKALAFVGACRVRGAKESTFIQIGKCLGFCIPFERNTKELELLKAIADCYKSTTKGPITLGGVRFDADEARRAGLLLRNEFNFLDEDYYDTDSYK
jgi:LysM repeat protein